MKRCGIFLLSLFLLAPWLAAQEVIKIAAGPGVERFYPILSAIYAELSFHAEFIVLPPERALRDANSGLYDADLLRAAGVLGPYPNLVCTTEPIFSIDVTAWAKRGSSIVIASPADLKNYRTSTVIGAKLPEALLASLGIKAENTTDQEALAKMLSEGRIDIALATSNITDTPVYDVGVMVAPRLLSSPLFHVLHARRVALIPRFDAILKAMKADGRYEKLLKQ